MLDRPKHNLSLQVATDILAEAGDDFSLDALGLRLRVNDDVVRAGAYYEYLNKTQKINRQFLETGVELSAVSPKVARSLAPVLVRKGLFGWLDDLQEVSNRYYSTLETTPTQMYLEALNTGDTRKHLTAYNRLYLETLNRNYIENAVTLARTALHYEKAIEFYLRLLLIEKPPHVGPLFELFYMIWEAGDRQAWQVISPLASKLTGCEIVERWRDAVDERNAKRPSNAAAILEEYKGSLKSARARAHFEHQQGELMEELGDFRAAAEHFAKSNKWVADRRIDPYGHIKLLKQANNLLPMPRFRVEESGKTAIMCGFPRSGTTLLENALSAHPDIAIAEESSALTSTLSTAYSKVGRNTRESFPEGGELDVIAAAHHHASLYQRALERAAPSSGRVLIDKTPILSGYIKYLEHLFPLKPYIFSIRHPFDVVISNFKQRYKQNLPMAAFNEMHSACDLYDYIMTNWFEVFPGETDRVCYVYYDELVTDFEPTVRRVIEFLGVEWDDAVLDFAEHSKKRAVRTPSYANVRKGLSLGVQSSYQNYLFLFDDYCRSKLDPWVEFFGYTVEDPKR